MTVDPGYTDPTRSQTKWTVVTWPRRNWAMKLMLAKTPTDKPSKWWIELGRRLREFVTAS